MIKRTKLQDIAKQVGVTRMTVSRYFNDPQSVAKKTRDKISKVIEESGFIPNRVPAIMSKSSSKSLGLIVPSFSNGVFSDIIDAVDTTARERGYNVLLTHSGYDPLREEQQVADLLSYQVDSIILCDSVHTDLTMKRLKNSGLPLAEILSFSKDPVGLNIGINYEKIFKEMTATLIKCGRKHIAYFGVRMDPRTIERQHGYEEAMTENHLYPLCFTTTRRSNFTLGRDLLIDAFKEHPEIDAVLCTNDDVALGVLIAAQALSISVPEQLTVIGCNALNICEAAIPRLCSIKTPRHEIAKDAVTAILNELESGEFKTEVREGKCSFLEGESATKEEQKLLAALF